MFLPRNIMKKHTTDDREKRERAEKSREKR